MSTTTKTGVELIAEERREQIKKHRRTILNDVKTNNRRQLRVAAMRLLHPDCRFYLNTPPNGWDVKIWNKMVRKPIAQRLIIAGALIAAEWDRLNNIPYVK
jgi:hypothetical protein